MTFLPRDFLRADAGNGLSAAGGIKVTGQTCQWIEGPITGDDTCKCGKPVIGRLPGRAPYCPEHAGRCFESTAAWKKRNAWLKDLDGGFAQMSLKDWMECEAGDGE